MQKKFIYIDTKLYYDRFHNDDYWEKDNVTFNEYKNSLKRHLGNTNFNSNTNKYKHIIKERIDKAKTINDIKKAFSYDMGIKIDIKHDRKK